jgi:hypothetical protein
MFVGLCSYACELSALCNAIFEDFPKQLMLQIHVVAISGRFTANAKEKIVYKLPKGLVGSVLFLDREPILELIDRYWSSA